MRYSLRLGDYKNVFYCSDRAINSNMKLSAALVILSALVGCSVANGGAQTRIAGGEDAVLGQLPYQAALSVGGSYNCGAVIIAERYALTALTCVCSAGKDTA